MTAESTGGNGDGDCELPGTTAPTADRRVQVAVVGAGVTGLSLVHHLRTRGVAAVALEATGRPGGVVRSDRADGHVVERGPHRIRRTDPVDELIADLGLEDAVIAADDDLPLYVYRDGKLRVVPRSVGEFVRTDLVSERAKLRVLVEPFTGPGRGDERAAALFRRKFGDEVYESVIEPLFSGIYASDPAAMPARYALDGLLRAERHHGSLLAAALSRVGGETAPPISFEGGLERLPRALYEANADAVHLETPVRAVREADGAGRARSDTGDGPTPPYEVVTDGPRVAADRVVVTTPASAASDVLSDLAPGAADALSELTYNPIAMVSLRATTDREGFGYQVHAREDLRTRGVTFVESLFDRERLYTAFLGGMRDPDVLAESDEKLAETAAAEFETVLGVAPEVVDVHRLRAYPAYDTTWRALDDLSLPPGVELATNYTARIGVPSRVREARSVAERLAGELAAADQTEDTETELEAGADAEVRDTVR